MAARAGVSAAIVSVVVSGREGGGIRVGPATRQRVWDAVRELGYVPNPVARSLAGGRSRMLGVFTYEPVFPIERPNFYYPFLVGIEEEAEARDYDLVLFTRTDASGNRAIYRNGVNQLQIVDGAIMFGTKEDRDELARLVRDGFPFVFIGRRDLGTEQLSYVAADYVNATKEVTRHVLDCGHRQVALLAGPDDHETVRDRRDGFRAAFTERATTVDENLVFRLRGEELTTEFVRAQLDRGVTAFVTEGGDACRTLLDVLASLGVRVPDAVSVASLGSFLHEAELPPSVTTFDIPRNEMGHRALALLDEILSKPDDPAPRREMLPCTFVEGRTVAAPPAN